MWKNQERLIPQIPPSKKIYLGTGRHDCQETFSNVRIFTIAMEFFLNGAELSLISANSGNLINHWCMNWSQFEYPVSHMYLAGAVVASWSLTWEVAEWYVRVPFTVMSNFLSLNSANSVKKKNQEKLQWTLVNTTSINQQFCFQESLI